MKIINSKLNEDVNFKNKKQRINLYRRVFLKYSMESRIYTLQQAAIDLSAKSGIFASNGNQEAFEEFAISIGGIETAIEFMKLSIESLEPTSTSSKYEKLKNLKLRTDKEEAIQKKKDEELKDNEEEAEEINKEEEIPSQSEATEAFNRIVSSGRKKSFFGWLFFWK